MASHFDRGLGISVEAPADWERGATADFPLLLVAPREHDFRSNVGFSRAAAPPTEEAMAAAIAAARAAQARDYPQLEVLDESVLTLDGQPAYVQHYQWRPPGAAEPLVAIFGLVRAGEHGLVEINGSTVLSSAGARVPEMIALVRSLRFIPFD